MPELLARDQMSSRAFLAELLMAECDRGPAFDFDATPSIDPATVNTLAPVTGSRRASRSA